MSALHVGLLGLPIVVGRPDIANDRQTAIASNPRLMLHFNRDSVTNYAVARASDPLVAEEGLRCLRRFGITSSGTP